MNIDFQPRMLSKEAVQFLHTHRESNAVVGAVIRAVLFPDEFQPPQAYETMTEMLRTGTEQMQAGYERARQSNRDRQQHVRDKRKQERNATHRDIALCNATHRDGALVTRNGNENEMEKNIKKNETNTVSPPSNASLSFVSVEAVIDETAELLGDRNPSRKSWRAFIAKHGVEAFKGIAASVAESDARNKGAYLNSALERYQPPQPSQPQAASRKNRTFKLKDWGLCSERCALFDSERCACRAGEAVPPEHDENHPHPPEECNKFKPQENGQESEAAVDFDALVRGIGTRVNAK